MKVEDWVNLDFSKGLKESRDHNSNYPRPVTYGPGECPNLVNMDITSEGLVTRRGFIANRIRKSCVGNRLIPMGEALNRVYYCAFQWNFGDLLITTDSAKIYRIEKSELAKLGRGDIFTNSAGYDVAYGVTSYSGTVVYGGVYEYAGKVYAIAKRNAVWRNLTDNTTFTGPAVGTVYPASDIRGFNIPSFVWRDRVWCYDRDSARVFFSKAGGPTVWAAPDGGDFYVGVPDKAKIVEIVPATDYLHIFTTEGYYTFRYGSDPNRDGQLINISNKYSFSHALNTKDSRVFALADSLYEVSQGQLQDVSTQVSLEDATGITYVDDTILVYFSDNKPFKAYNIETGTWSRYIVPFEEGQSFKVDSTYTSQFEVPSETNASADDVFLVGTSVKALDSTNTGIRPVVVAFSRDKSCYVDLTANSPTGSTTPHTIRYRLVVDGSSMEETLSPFTWSKFRQATITGFWPETVVDAPLRFGMTDIYGPNAIDIYEATYSADYGTVTNDPLYMNELETTVVSYPTFVDPTDERYAEDSDLVGSASITSGFRGKLIDFPNSASLPGFEYLSRLVRFGLNQRARRPVFMIDLLVGDNDKLVSSDSVILTDNPNDLPPSIFTGIKVSIAMKRAPVNEASSLS